MQLLEVCAAQPSDDLGPGCCTYRDTLLQAYDTAGTGSSTLQSRFSELLYVLRVIIQRESISLSGK